MLGSKQKVTTSSVCLKILIPKITYQHIICPNAFQHIFPKYSKYLITQLLRPQLRKQTGRWCIGWMGLGSSGCNMWWTCGRDVSFGEERERKHIWWVSVDFHDFSRCVRTICGFWIWWCGCLVDNDWSTNIVSLSHILVAWINTYRISIFVWMG